MALGWAHLSPPPPFPAGKGESPKETGVRSARAEAERALSMSREMGYHWGVVDAEEVLQRMRDEG